MRETSSDVVGAGPTHNVGKGWRKSYKELSLIHFKASD